MKLTWYGHACFQLEWDQGSVVFDPYLPDYIPGMVLPPLEADAVFCSHGHGDHSYAEGVSIPAAPREIRARQVSCWHDNAHGALRGPNTITLVEAEGKTAAHLGDLGHLLSGEQLQALGEVDLLMIPVGGFYTIDAAEAKQITELIRPRIIVPMHYRNGDKGLQKVSEVEPFLNLFPEEKIVRLPESSADPFAWPDGSVLVFPWPGMLC